MRMSRVLTCCVAVVAVAALCPASGSVSAQAPASTALSGVVSSAEEGKMEGVLVTARRTGAPFSVTVATDAQGRYAFPKANLEPGPYALTIRAVGYDLSAAAPVDVTADKTAHADLALVKTKDLAAQLTSMEWYLSIPGTPEQKAALVRQTAACGACHSMERIVRSKYTAEQWPPVIRRMTTYNGDKTSLRRHQKNPGSESMPLQGPGANPLFGSAPVKDLAEYLATINLSRASTWPYELKTVPRPKGRATKVIVTVYDIPRQPSVMHDLDVDGKGNVWYGNSGWDYIGKLDPKTNIFSEYESPNHLPAESKILGVMDIQVDKDNRIWAGLPGPKFGYFDPSTLRWTLFDLPPASRGISFIAPFYGRETTVWGKETGAGLTAYRLDPRTSKVDAFKTFAGAPPGPHSMYMIDRDAEDNAWFQDFGSHNIGTVDGKTGKVTLYPTPTPNAFPRRGNTDAQGRFWFGEFYADQLGYFDTKAKTFAEFPIRPYAQPYYARPLPNGEIWTSSLGTDRVYRFDTKTREFVEYLMPVYYDARKVAFDPSSPRPTIWLPSKNTAQIIRVQPLD